MVTKNNRWLACCLAIMFPLAAMEAQVTKDDYVRSDSILNLERHVYNPGVRPQWLGDSHYFWYQNREKQGTVFYLVDSESGQKLQADSKEALAQYLNDEGLKTELLKERKPFDWWAESRKPAEPVASPDSLWEAYIQDNNLYVRSCKDPKETVALTMDGIRNYYYSDRMIQWSPDSKKLATVRVRDVEERRIPLLESRPATQLQPILQWRDYAKPGDVLPVSVPVLFNWETKQQIPLETKLYENQFGLHLTGWREDSRAFTFEFNQRGHQRYIVGEVDASTGRITHLVDEQVPTFFYYNWRFRHDLADGKEMLWISERDGWRHLYLLDDKGNVKQQVTKGEWVVRNVDYVDEENRVVYFNASGFNKGEDPYHLHYCRINIDGTGFKDLTPEDANHEVVASKDRKFLVDAYSRADMPYTSVLRNAEGKVTAVLGKSDISELLAEGWVMPEVFCAKGRDGKTDIWGKIIRPSTFDETKSYPVVEMIYAGPHDSHVEKYFRATDHLCSRLAELGFIVVKIDGMGTANRSKAFHDVCWKNLKDAGFPDRIAWIKSASEKYPYMDTTRVGIYGWSAGGQNAMAALLWHNDFYKVAVALCGCHDNRMDKVWWNEQWMGYPIDQSYSESSNVDNAWRLKGKLLLINGELDDNVDPASTLQVVSELMKANKDFDQLYLPGKTHSLGGTFEMHKLHDFFVEHLYHQDPPEWE